MWWGNWQDLEISVLSVSPCLWRPRRYVFIRWLLFRLHVNGLPPLCSPNPLPPTFPSSLVKHRIQDEGFGHFCDHFAQFSWVFPTSCCSVPKLCRAVCHPMNCSTPDSSVLRYLPEFAQPHIPCLHVIKFLFDFLLFMSIQFSDQSEEPRRLKENSFLPDQIMYLSKFEGGVECHIELYVQVP